MSQLDLFGNIQREPPISQRPDPDRIRLILDAAIQELRRADTIPWDGPRLRSWQHVFPNMTRWLPAEEGIEINRQFNSELARLRDEFPIFDKKTG